MHRITWLVAGLALFRLGVAAEQNPTDMQLALVDMQGQKKVLGILPNTVFAPRVSPDGKRVAFELTDAGDTPSAPPIQRLYVAELDKIDQRRPLPPTLTTTRSLAPVWSPDGDWIAFLATGNGTDELFIQRADGSIQPKHLVTGRAAEGLYSGGLLAFITLTGNRDYGISLFDMNTRKVFRLIDYPGTEQHSGRLSPDGKWVAYASNETGRQEVWLEPLPQTGKRTQLTTLGGRHPQWSPDGTKLYYDLGDRMFQLDLTLTADSLRSSAPVQMPISGFQQGDLRRQYDLMPDGKGFVMLFPLRAPQ
jgi:eukaryotic-like serine/threonine-protein kinase